MLNATFGETRISRQLSRREVDRQFVERRGELLIVRDFASHQERQRVLDTWIVSELLQVLVNDLGPRLRGQVAAKVNSRVAVGVDERAGPVVPAESLTSGPPPLRTRNSGFTAT